jgi:hypothetical protein
MGLKYAQWFILAGITVLLTVIIIKEKYYSQRKPYPVAMAENPGKNLLFTAMLTMFVFLVSRFLITVELLMIGIIFIPAWIKVGWSGYNHFYGKPFRWIPPVALLTGLVLMSQSYLPENESENVTFTELGVAGMYSSYATSIREYLGEYAGACGGTYHQFGEPNDVRYHSVVTGVELSSYTLRSKYKSIMFRGSAFYGYDIVDDMTSNTTYSESTFGFSPYLQFDWRPVGFGFGFLVGRFRFATMEKSVEKMSMGDWENAPNEYRFYPQLYFRAGPRDIAFVDMSMANYFPSSSPMPLWRLGIGTGMGEMDGRELIVGASEAGAYIQTAIPIRERYMITGFTAYNFKSGMDSRYLLSVGFKYRFNFKVVPKKKVQKEDTNLK